MRKEKRIVFDDYVKGATAAVPAYSSVQFNRLLGRFDRFALECIVDDVSASSALDIFIEHSPDGEHWLHKNGTADNPPVTGQGDVKWATLSTTAANTPGIGDSGSTPLFALARLQIFFGNSTTGAHIRVTVTPRDSR
jgi:hypothetical protein